MWASTYHDGIVWCNQLVRKLSTMMLQIASDLNQGHKGTCLDHGIDGGSASCPPGGEGDEGPPRGGGMQDLLTLRNDLVMRHVKHALIGRDNGGLHQRLFLRADGHNRPPGPPVKLHDALRGASGRRQCTGANLVWYLQYNSPKPVTKALFQLDHSSIKKVKDVCPDGSRSKSRPDPDPRADHRSLVFVWSSEITRHACYHNDRCFFLVVIIREVLGRLVCSTTGTSGLARSKRSGATSLPLRS